VVDTITQLLYGVPGIEPAVRMGSALGNAATSYLSSPGLGAVPGLTPAGKLVPPPEVGRAKAQTDIEPVDPKLSEPLPAVDPEGKTAANADDRKSFATPSQAPGYFNPQPVPGGAQPTLYGREGFNADGSFSGPFTPEVMKQGGFGENSEIAATFMNWLTRRENPDMDTATAATVLFGGTHWTGPTTDHPANLGWSGGVYDKKPTSAAGVPQFEKATWDENAPRFGINGSKEFSLANQGRVATLMSAEKYQQATGRNLFADMKEGRYEQIAAVLAPTWPSLNRQQAVATGDPQADRMFNIFMGKEAEYQTWLRGRIDDYIKRADAADPASAEMKEWLHKAMLHSEELARSYEKAMREPPVAQTPFQAAGELGPLLTIFAALGGLATRRPALGAANALNGVLTGLKEGNDQLYNNSFDLWKTQVGMASKAFDIQNTVVGNIIEDLNLTNRERQQKLQDAFRVFGMENDLKLAGLNQWERIYQRAQDWADHKTERELKVLQFNKAVEEANELAWAKSHGVEFLTAAELSKYRTGYGKFKLENQREPLEAENLGLIQQAQTRTSLRELTPKQRADNADIDKARKKFDMDHLPPTFEEDVAAVQNKTSDVLDHEPLVKKGYNTIQEALYHARTRPPSEFNKTAADVELLKDWATANKTKLEAQSVPVTDTGYPIQQQQQLGYTEADLNAKVDAARANNADRDATRALYLEFGAPLGLNEATFTLRWPPPTGSATGPIVAQPRRMEQRTLGLEPQYGM
jgi:muramidase (phage lysozyme)